MWAKRAERIRQIVRVADILEQEGFDVLGSNDGEQQFRCHLHGTGQDNKPSARLYPDTNSWYCWGCQKARDPISTIRDARGVTFREVVRLLERSLNLPPLPEQTDEVETPLILSAEETLEQQFQRMDNLLRSLRVGGDTSWRFLARVWWVLDEARALPEGHARQMLGKIHTAVMSELKAQWTGSPPTP